ncbi:MAG TPA: hypothetical protein VM124_02160 [Candidatus Limnocylindrales bacterium]|nr:hypothetical protein [Candidatus Limnocylindrales bacterium]
MSNQERLLTDCMGLEEQWAHAAGEVVTWRWKLDEQAKHHAWLLRLQILDGTMSEGDLRQGVVYANALDREAYEQSGGDIAALGQEDYFEAVARRIAHHAGRFALKRNY